MYLDDPGHRIYETAMEAHFGNHPMGMSVLGSADSIRKLERDQMAKYFRQRYGPGNMVLAATGRLDFDDVVKLAERYCGRWVPVDAARHQPAPIYKTQKHAIVDRKLNRQYTVGVMPAPSAQDERRFAARVLGDVIGDAEGSRLFWALVDNAVAEEADFGFDPHDGCGSYSLFLVSEPERMAKAIDIAINELHRVVTDLSDAEVERAKNKIASSLVLQGELPMGRMRSIASQWIYNRDYRSLDVDTATLEALTADTLRQLMKEFPFDPLTMVTLGPMQPLDGAEPIKSR